MTSSMTEIIKIKQGLVVQKLLQTNHTLNDNSYRKNYAKYKEKIKLICNDKNSNVKIIYIVTLSDIQKYYANNKNKHEYIK